jgi:hypothetical protein
MLGDRAPASRENQEGIPRMNLKRSEADVMRSVKALLKATGILSFRMNSGDRFGSYKGKVWRIMGNPTGTADLLCFIPKEGYVLPLWIEAKSSIGKQSPEQKQFQEMVENEGHSYLLARSAEDLHEWLTRIGY